MEQVRITDFYDELIESEHKEEISIIKCELNDNGKIRRGLDSLFKNKTKNELIETIENMFLNARKTGNDLGLNIDELTFKLISEDRGNFRIHGIRIETDDEFKSRMWDLAERRADDMKRYKKNKAYIKIQRENRIRELEDELKELRE